MHPRSIALLTIISLSLTSCGGGGGGGGGGATPPPGPQRPVIGLLPGSITTTGAVIVPLQASGTQPMTTTWTFPSGATAAVHALVLAPDGTTHIRFATTGTWQAIATVTNAGGSATIPLTLLVESPTSRTLAGQVLGGPGGTIPEAGIPWRLSWMPVPDVSLPLGGGTTDDQGRWSATALVAPPEQFTVHVDP